jgi:hypothetical protein
MMRETLTRPGYPASDAQGYTGAVRSSRYDLTVSTDAEQHALEQMMGEEKRSETITGS